MKNTAGKSANANTRGSTICWPMCRTTCVSVSFYTKHKSGGGGLWLARLSQCPSEDQILSHLCPLTSCPQYAVAVTKSTDYNEVEFGFA